MPIPNKRKLEWVSDDIEDGAVIAERYERARQSTGIKRIWAARKHEAQSRTDYNSYLRGRGLSAAQADIVSHGDMPAVKKGRKKPIGIGATYRAKQKAANFGATPSFNRALVAAVKKVENRAVETTYSQSGLYMDSSLSTFTQTGYSMSGLNSSAAYSASTPTTRANATNQCLVWPLSPMAQVGNTSTPGYRKGQRISPIGFRFSVEHDQQLATMNVNYKWALVRNKGQTLTSNATIPGITGTNSLGLFVPLVQGPLVSSGGPSGSLPMGNFSSCMRWNRQEWSVMKSGTWSMGAVLSRENASVISAPQTSSNVANVSRCVTGYAPIKDKFWDYPAPTATTGIKGGDYFFIVWREGSADAYIARDQMSFVFEFSFKDP